MGCSPDGEPSFDGFNCSEPNGEFYSAFKNKKGDANVDFIFKKRGPASYDGNPKAWLIGDIKLSMRQLYDTVTEPKRQWIAISKYANYANGHQFSPITFFIIWRNNGVEGTQQKLQQEALEKGVFMYALSVFD